jgi:sphingomyelin phosphodiesterase
MIKSFLFQFAVLVGMCLTSEAQTVRILSWNIKMLPRQLSGLLNHRPLVRTKYIPSEILKDSVDIICFQEAFDMRANKLLFNALKDKCPYIAGPANHKKGSIKLNSGVVFLSKYPLKVLGTVDFRECEKEDCYARKGGLLVECTVGEKVIQLMGTHMEAGGTAELKRGQLSELKGLITKHVRSGVPQFLMGDFNISKSNRDLYSSMLDTLQAEDGPITGELQYTSDHLLNDMSNYSTSRNVIDFILYKPNGENVPQITRYVRRYRVGWRKSNSDLSDHFAVWAEIRW